MSGHTLARSDRPSKGGVAPAKTHARRPGTKQTKQKASPVTLSTHIRASKRFLLLLGVVQSQGSGRGAAACLHGDDDDLEQRAEEHERVGVEARAERRRQLRHYVACLWRVLGNYLRY